MLIRVNDTVQVITGDDRGTRAKVLRVIPGKNKLVVEGVNLVYKHMRRSQRNPQGGRLSKEMPISVSNVQLIDPKTNEPTRVGVRYLADGTKERYAKGSGVSLGTMSGPRPKYAKSSG